jgi:MFS family permease
VGRLPALFVVSAGAAMASLVMALLAPGWMGSVLLCLVIGGLSHPVYALGVAWVNDRLDPRDFVRSGGALLIAFCLGTTSGPTAAAMTMMWLGDDGLYFFLASILCMVAIGVVITGCLTRTSTTGSR